MNREAIIKLPFPGFYNSWYSGGLDYEEERFLENEVEERGRDRQHVAEAIDQARQWYIQCAEVARNYVGELSYFLARNSDLCLTLEYESTSSPKYYNFETDRVFAHIDRESIYTLAFRADEAILSDVIKDRFTSRSGFFSGYSNRIVDWLDKPLQDWDHNELETLLIAAIHTCAGLEGTDISAKDWEFDLYSSIAQEEVFFKAFESGMDWAAYETKLAELEEWDAG